MTGRLMSLLTVQAYSAELLFGRKHKPRILMFSTSSESCISFCVLIFEQRGVR
jgi:hypothetical protein